MYVTFRFYGGWQLDDGRWVCAWAEEQGWIALEPPEDAKGRAG